MYVTERFIKKDGDEAGFLAILTGQEMVPNAFNYGTACTVTKDLNTNERDMPNIEDVDRKINELLASVPKEAFDKEWLAKNGYVTYQIPKQNGKMRRIDEPVDWLRAIHTQIENILTYDFGALYHNAAWAYVKYRNTRDCLKVHKDSNWFMKTDFHNFFGSTTLRCIVMQLKYIYPFRRYLEKPEREANFRSMISLCMLNDGLPQGTTISPMLTNIIMIQFDYRMSSYCYAHGIKYTRYADDCLFSSEMPFEKRDIIREINHVCRYLWYPYHLNREKTRYGSVKGKNFNLGLMINAEHNITIGHEAKRRLKADLHKLVLDFRKHGVLSKEWLMSFQGRLNYYRFIEPYYVERIEYRVLDRNRLWWYKIDSLFRIAFSNI